MLTTTTVPPLCQLYVESDMDAPQVWQVPEGHVVAFCRRCPEKIEPNDDSAAIMQTAAGALVMVVADGVGGSPLGYKASSIAVQSVIENVRHSEHHRDLRPAILDGIERANREILDLGVGAATTLAVVEVHDRMARAYQVGDSTTLMIGGRGALKWKSTPHSPVGYAVQSGLLDEADAMHHDQRHVVSNLVGSRTMHIEIGPSRLLSPRDCVIVASDGLFDNLHVAEVIEHARRGKPEQRMRSLCEAATDRMTTDSPGQPGKPDDLAVLLLTP